MKKVSILFTAMVAVSLVACGPSKAEIEAKEKAKQDSLVAVAKADSMAAAEKMAAEKLTAQQDSIKVAEETKVAEEAKAAEEKGSHHSTTKHKDETTSPRTGASKEGSTNSGTPGRAGAVKEK